MTHSQSLAFALAAFLAITTDRVIANDDWLQFQFDAANHGRAPNPVEPPFQLRWVWYGEDNVVVVGRPCPEGKVPRPPNDSVGLLSFTMHAVVADGRVIFGDLMASSIAWTRGTAPRSGNNSFLVLSSMRRQSTSQRLGNETR